MEKKEPKDINTKKNYVFKKNESDPMGNIIKEIYIEKREGEIEIKYIIYKTENGNRSGGG